MFLIVICWIISKFMCLLKCFAYNQLRTRTFLWQPTSSDELKNSVKGGEKSSLFELRRLEIGGVSFDDFSLLHASFSSEAGVVLTFFAYFFALRQKE